MLHLIIKRLDGFLAKATYFQMMAPEANRPGNPPLKWSGNDFSYTSSGRSTSPLSNPGVRRQLLLPACRRVDSLFLLPTGTRCLMEMLPVEVRHGGKQN